MFSVRETGPLLYIAAYHAVAVPPSVTVVNPLPPVETTGALIVRWSVSVVTPMRYAPPPVAFCPAAHTATPVVVAPGAAETLVTWTMAAAAAPGAPAGPAGPAGPPVP